MARNVSRACAPLTKRSAPRDLCGPASLRLPMPSLGDDDVLPRAEAGARWAWRALLAAAAEDVRAILAGEALACKRSFTRPRGSAAGGALVYQPHRVPGDRSATTAPPKRAFANESPADRARTLFFDVAEARAVAAEELQTTNTSSRGIQHSRLHGYSRRSDCALMGESIISNCSYKHENQKTRANQRASPTVWINPIGSAVAADKSLKRAATHLARYCDCARVARRYDRLHGKPSPPSACGARCSYFRRMEKRDSGDRGGEGCQGRRRKRQQGGRRQAKGERESGGATA